MNSPYANYQINWAAVAGRFAFIGLWIPLMFTLLPIAGVAQTSMNVYKYNRRRTEKIINTKCAAEWPNDRRMHAHCYRQQWNGLNQLQQPMPRDLNGQQFNTIRKKCGLQWEPDFQMWAYCERQQREALLKLRTRNPRDLNRAIFKKITKLCAKKWPMDYQMRDYCEVQAIETLRKNRAKLAR